MALGLGLGTGIHYQGDTLSKGAALFWDFEHMGVIPSNLTFTRATAAQAWNDSGVLAAYAINAPALARAIPSGRRGLVMQGARTNGMSYYNTPNDGSWLNSNVTVTAGQTTGIDGTASGWKLAATTTAGGTALSKLWTNNATSVCFYAVVKKGTGATTAQRFLLRNNTAATDLCVVLLNYDTGATTLSSGAGSYGSINYGNGWWLVWISVSSGITSGDTCRGYVGWTSGNATAGDHIYFDHIGAEIGATFPSLPVPTTTGAGSRSADFCTHTLSAALAAALSTQGTMVVEYSLLGANSATGGGRYIIDLTSANGNNRHLVYHSGASLYAQTKVNGSNVASSYGGTIAANATAKIGYSFDGSNVLLGINGNVAAPVVSASPESIANVVLGDGQGGGASLFGSVIRVHIYTHAMSATQLAQVTV